ncbi:MAG: bacteriohopanetetrol glucosamine biosynthesis glycosyltransferase HpnI [Alphaproteobacteria bacterium]|nr:bacteriohopanetetrol glucosamine biosynthesis glycosyltransferase HpnI [Alphaproteobacteria bacterium]
MLIHWLALCLSGLGLVGIAYTLVVARMVARFEDCGRTRAAGTPVTILKPLHFEERGLREALKSFLDQDYEAPVQIIFGVQDGGDPAIAIVRALMAEFPKADIELVMDGRPHGTNRKVSNLINMSRVAKHEIIVLSDSDITVAPDWLSRIVAALSAADVGAVSCLYSGKPNGNAWSKLAAMGSSYEFLPNVVAGLSFGLAAPCFGSTIAIRRETLRAVGGFEAFANRLADDYEIGRAVRSLGLKVAIPAFTVDHASSESGPAELYRHEVRWNRTTRLIDPVGHAGSLITHAVPLALLGAAAAGFDEQGLAVLAAAVVARLLLKWTVERKFATYAGPALALPLRDLISFSVFVASFFAENVHWRGSRFAVSPSGALSQP